MLLVIDIGNTNIVLAVFNGNKLQSSCRFKTNDEKALTDLKNYLESISVDEAVISSVVPNCTEKITNLLNCRYLLISRNINTNLDADTIPVEMGNDILCNVVKAHQLYPNEYVTVADFGTAFTTATVSPQGKVLGVTIAPGLWTSIKSLFLNTAQIPAIRLDMPEKVLGTDTVESVRAGVVFGIKGQLEAIVNQIEKEINHRVLLVATGGFSKYISKVCDRIDVCDTDWTVKGAKMLFDLNN